MADTTASQKAVTSTKDPEHRRRQIEIGSALIRAAASVWGLILKPLLYGE